MINLIDFLGKNYKFICLPVIAGGGDAMEYNLKLSPILTNLTNNSHNLIKSNQIKSKVV